MPLGGRNIDLPSSPRISLAYYLLHVCSFCSISTADSSNCTNLMEYMPSWEACRIFYVNLFDWNSAGDSLSSMMKYRTSQNSQSVEKSKEESFRFFAFNLPLIIFKAFALSINKMGQGRQRREERVIEVGRIWLGVPNFPFAFSLNFHRA